MKVAVKIKPGDVQQVLDLVERLYSGDVPGAAVCLAAAFASVAADRDTAHHVLDAAFNAFDKAARP